MYANYQVGPGIEIIEADGPDLEMRYTRFPKSVVTRDRGMKRSGPNRGPSSTSASQHHRDQIQRLAYSPRAVSQNGAPKEAREDAAYWERSIARGREGGGVPTPNDGQAPEV